MASILPAAITGGESDRVLKSMDANRYATKKTIAQGMLDIALLTANASQLKYILQVGEKHEFYTLMLTLISISIILQVTMGVLNLSLSLLRDCRLHLPEYHQSANVINYIVTGAAFMVTMLNLMISAFDPMVLKYVLD
nr:ninjurin-1-like isoform X2 [Aedes albopictus]